MTVSEMVRERKDGYLEAIEELEEQHAGLLAACKDATSHAETLRRRLRADDSTASLVAETIKEILERAIARAEGGGA